MRGSVVKRGKGTWALVFDLGHATDPTTGRKRRRQKWVSFKGTKNEAQARLTELLGSRNAGTYVAPAKVTFGEYMRTWHAQLQSAAVKRWRTCDAYGSVVERIGAAPLAAVPLQAVTASDIETYLAGLVAAPATVALHHAVIRTALQKAVKNRRVTHNAAKDGVERPARPRTEANARENCWTQADARRFLASTAELDAQSAAFFALAMDTGARKGELHGVTWERVDLDAGRVDIVGQLDGLDADGRLDIAPTKSGRERTVTLGPETVALLRAHRVAQAELKMRNRRTYEDHGLVFAKEAAHLQEPDARLGHPLHPDTLARRAFHAVREAAGVKRITFHGLRHTSATLLLAAGVPVHVVSARLGHKNASMTLDVYAHALPDQQQAAAERLGALLHR